MSILKQDFFFCRLKRKRDFSAQIARRCKSGQISEFPKKKGGKGMEKDYFTSESVTEGHPDKICDADF